ncbi:RHS domain-containing protein [Spongiibacter nanhainus]|uniref:RHS domain-containing protein n=1 Tax=Spongiibacter nanhainus TaxID=2794344 RepID=A0A7T4URX3_9GAMM|nr:RHS domain-containing protein [Spongiibacter nanhainus]
MHTDHLGTPKVMTDAAGQPVWQASSTPYGEMKTASLTQSENPLRFPGQYVDAETGSAYNYFRDYAQRHHKRHRWSL